MQPILGMPSDQIVRIAIFVVVLAVIWFILRTIMRITLRIFTFGCGAILVLGILLFALRYLGHY